MAVGDFENILPRTPKVREIEDYASAWWDMRTAAQMIHGQVTFDVTPANYFTRRAIWDGAVITYARCFMNGRRDTDILALVAGLDDEMRATHDTILQWRNQHSAHRVDPTLESVGITLLWAGFGTHQPVVRVRIMTHPQPDDATIEGKFEALASTLANQIWEKFIYPLQQELFDELGTAAMLELKGRTQLITEKDWPKDVMSVALDVGSVPPPDHTRPAPTPRKPKRASRKRT